MLSLFRTNQFISNILLLFYVLVLRGSVFLVPTQEVTMSQPGLLSHALYSWIGQVGALPDFVALVLVLIQALLINVIVAKFRMAQFVSLYPGLFYILIVSSFPDFLHLSPVIMANTFLIMALYEVFGSYKKYSSAKELFNVGLFIGLAGLFYFSMLFFLLTAIIGFVMLRSFKLKELLMLLFGFISPFWLVGIWYFFIGQLPMFWQQAFSDNVGAVQWASITTIITYAQLVFFSALLLLVLFSYNRYTHKVSIQAHKNMDTLYWFLAIAGFSLFFQHGVMADHLLMLAVPVAILFSMTMLYMNNRMAEALHFLLVAGMLLMQTQSLWNG